MKRGIIILLFSMVALLSCERKNEQINKLNDEKNLRILDSINLLSATEKQDLFKIIHRLEKNTGSQVAIVIIDTLKAVAIEDFSMEMLNKFDLGRDEYNDGLLITIAYKDHSIRIEVGYGLERIITNEIANSIIEEKMVPKFKDKKFFDGIYAALQKIEKLIEENKDLIGKGVLK